MKNKILIVGIGRIGRRLIHILAKKNINAFIYDRYHINDIYHALKYDSVYGRCKNIQMHDNVITISNTNFIYSNELNADIVIDCTGKEIEYENAKKIIRSYPKGDQYYIFDTKMKDISKRIISNASCTTQAIAPVLYRLQDFIQEVHFTTIHSYTNDQKLVDSFHDDQYRSRAAAMSMIPTSTGASKILSAIFPTIQIAGKAIRVPTLNVSCIDLTILLKKEINIQETINLLNESQYIECTNDKLVSIDCTENSASAIIDINKINIMNQMMNILIWYDNEHGYSMRLCELLLLIDKDLQNSSSPQSK